jgi:hypothetical protein
VPQSKAIRNGDYRDEPSTGEINAIANRAYLH